MFFLLLLLLRVCAYVHLHSCVKKNLWVRVPCALVAFSFFPLLIERMNICYFELNLCIFGAYCVVIYDQIRAFCYAWIHLERSLNSFAYWRRKKRRTQVLCGWYRIDANYAWIQMAIDKKCIKQWKYYFIVSWSYANNRAYCRVSWVCCFSATIAGCTFYF